jgi:hypothetical protein
MDTHVKVVAWLWIISGALGIIGALCFGASTVGGGLISQDETAILVTSIVSLACGSFIFLESVIEIIAGIGLFKYRSWARILAIILGILNLFAFPLVLPLLLGIYTLWVMFNKETQLLFASEPDSFESSEVEVIEEEYE